MKLEICPIPSSLWGKSLAHVLSIEVWDALRKDVYKQDDYMCTACHRKELVLHAHECWVYDGRRKIQTLKEVVSLCEDCHSIIHWLRTLKQIKDKARLEYLIKHFCITNNCKVGVFNTQFRRAIVNSAKRKVGTWKVDWGIYNPMRLIHIYERLNRK